MTPPPSTFYDELLLPDGRARPGCEPVAAWLAATDAADI